MDSEKTTLCFSLSIYNIQCSLDIPSKSTLYWPYMSIIAYGIISSDAYGYRNSSTLVYISEIFNEYAKLSQTKTSWPIPTIQHI